MHPAPSVIVFTTLSGLGFGLLTFLALGLPSLSGLAAFWGYGAGFALAIGGLVSSTFHLGHPERALLAFTQWRTSWLSREAWAAVAALTVTGLHAIGPVFLGTRFALLGGLGAGLCVITVFTTSMIYASIRAVPRWHQPATPPLYLALSLAGGALLAGQAGAAAVLLAAAGAVQLWAWREGDAAFARAGTTIGTATGLGGRGAVRAFEPPHTGDNYLLREMVFVVARRHARKLRAIAFAAMIGLPLVLLALSGGALWASWLAAAIHAGGVAVQRWLFFAEAEHVVGLYYGRRVA
ncbi:MAG: DmsC/YnfH family molybdoenzyme membrane anchor subunit [Paracoccaceae bacterium]|jgi:DMSO reductase anchor subunit|nr:DmsC/YnfH family molybdoenzyme membrane anchor subunit [Paracoccaceae bacterium]